MGEYHRGEVVLVKFPFTDLRTTKLRPAIVLAAHGEDVIVVGVFSSDPTAIKETWLLIEEGQPHFSQMGLHKTSVVKGEKIAIIHGSIIHSVIGTCPPPLLEALAQRVKRALLLP